MSMICFDTYFGIDLGYVLAPILFLFWHPFGINVRVLGCSFLISFVDGIFNVFFVILRPNIQPLNLGRGFQGVWPPPQISRFGAASVPTTFVH